MYRNVNRRCGWKRDSRGRLIDRPRLLPLILHHLRAAIVPTNRTASIIVNTPTDPPALPSPLAATFETRYCTDPLPYSRDNAIATFSLRSSHVGVHFDNSANFGPEGFTFADAMFVTEDIVAELAD